MKTNTGVISNSLASINDRTEPPLGHVKRAQHAPECSWHKFEFSPLNMLDDPNNELSFVIRSHVHEVQTT